MSGPTLLTDEAFKAGGDAMIVTEGGERWIDTDHKRIIAAFVRFHATDGRDDLVEIVEEAMMLVDGDGEREPRKARAVIDALFGASRP